jgi:hypothetical protein
MYGRHTYILYGVIYSVMVTEGKGRLVSAGRAKTKYLSIPSAVVGDSQFPFEEGEEVSIEIDIDHSRLIVSKVKEE